MLRFLIQLHPLTITWKSFSTLQNNRLYLPLLYFHYSILSEPKNYLYTDLNLVRLWENGVDIEENEEHIGMVATSHIMSLRF